jgi:3-ketoacyl-CoA synthase
MVMNHFKMRNDVDTYHLGGMGCSSGVSAPGLAAKLLKNLPDGGYALVINHENVTTQLYPGTEKNFLVTNVIFRLGGSACLMTNKHSERKRAKYMLEQCIRTHTGADNEAFGCMSVKLDPYNVPGVYLPHPSILTAVTGKAVEHNVRRLAPLVLPVSEKLRFAKHWVQTKLMAQELDPFKPDVTKAFEHICIHAGGRIVIQALGKAFDLPDSYLEPAANTLYWYGNVSSASVWYTQAWIETVRGVKKGDRAWHIGLGAGFEANSAVWTALRDINTPHYAFEHVLGGREGEAMEVFLKCCNGGKAVELKQVRSMLDEMKAKAPPTPSRFIHPPYTHSIGQVQIAEIPACAT